MSQQPTTAVAKLPPEQPQQQMVVDTSPAMDLLSQTLKLSDLDFTQFQVAFLSA
ncbi:MAG: hypothetical protein GY696_18805 [Gammaproteobacteria bacterium]|nr:hypothetical protein [Gammaproteobacteria bacterium]